MRQLTTTARPFIATITIGAGYAVAIIGERHTCARSAANETRAIATRQKYAGQGSSTSFASYLNNHEFQNDNSINSYCCHFYSISSLKLSKS